VWISKREINNKTARYHRPTNRKKRMNSANVSGSCLFIKAYDSIHRQILYNIMEAFGFPQKLVALTKMCMEDTQYKIRVYGVRRF